MRCARRLQDVGALHRDGARARPDQAGDHPHQGGLAGAVRADHADRFARLDLEADAEQRLEGAVARIDRFQFEHARLYLATRLGGGGLRRSASVPR